MSLYLRRLGLAVLAVLLTVGAVKPAASFPACTSGTSVKAVIFNYCQLGIVTWFFPIDIGELTTGTNTNGKMAFQDSGISYSTRINGRWFSETWQFTQVITFYDLHRSSGITRYDMDALVDWRGENSEGYSVVDAGSSVTFDYTTIPNAGGTPNYYGYLGSPAPYHLYGGFVWEPTYTAILPDQGRVSWSGEEVEAWMMDQFQIGFIDRDFTTWTVEQILDSVSFTFLFEKRTTSLIPPTSVPEPATVGFALLAGGALMLAVTRRRPR